MQAKGRLSAVLSKWRGKTEAQDLVEDIKTILEQPKNLNSQQVDMIKDLDFFTDLESSQEIVQEIMFCQ